MNGADINLTLGEVFPRLVKAAQEQDGSRFLQWKLSGNCSEEDGQKIFDLALPAIVKLSCDQCGNFVVQKLLEHGGPEKHAAMLKQVKGHVLELSQHKSGCRVMQKMLEFLPSEMKVDLTAELQDKVVDCIHDMNGNHVIQKVVENLQPQNLGFVISAVAKKATEMASHAYGCRIIQRLLEHCDPDQLSGILDPVVKAATKLAKDSHANYVIQCILERGRFEDKRQILEVITGSVLDFATNKVSSNVVEKCFEISTVGSHANDFVEERSALMRAVLGKKSDPNAPIARLMKDKFGNYTVQRIIEHSRGDDWLELRTRIEDVEDDLKKSPTGKHIIAAFEKKIAAMEG